MLLTAIAGHRANDGVLLSGDAVAGALCPALGARGVVLAAALVALSLAGAGGTAEAEGIAYLRKGSETLAADVEWNERTVSLTPPFFSWY